MGFMWLFAIIIYGGIDAVISLATRHIHVARVPLVVQLVSETRLGIVGLLISIAVLVGGEVVGINANWRLSMIA